jgi:hypothetical protein
MLSLDILTGKTMIVGEDTPWNEDGEIIDWELDSEFSSGSCFSLADNQRYFHGITEIFITRCENIFGSWLIQAYAYSIL